MSLRECRTALFNTPRFRSLLAKLEAMQHSIHTSQVAPFDTEAMHRVQVLAKVKDALNNKREEEERTRSPPPPNEPDHQDEEKPEARMRRCSRILAQSSARAAVLLLEDRRNVAQPSAAKEWEVGRSRHSILSTAVLLKSEERRTSIILQAQHQHHPFPPSHSKGDRVGPSSEKEGEVVHSG